MIEHDGASGVREQPVSAGSSRSADISIVAVSYNTAHLLANFFAAIDAARGSVALQIIVVDNASTDGSINQLRAMGSRIELIENKANVGFGRANNQALARVAGRYVLLLNTDAFVRADTLTRTLDFMDAHGDVGVLGVRLTGRDGDLQPSCRYFPTPWNAFLTRNGLSRLFPATRLVDDMSWDHASVRDCDWVPGCYYLVRRQMVDRVGLFDPRYFVYYEEVDHCRRVRAAGWRVVYYPDTTVVHIGGESAKSAGQSLSGGRQIPILQIESELLYFRKQFGISGLAADICLTLLSDALSLCKRLLKGRSYRGAPPVTPALLETLVKTRFASRPSR
ncbi:MAG: glycosyltransferase family 2 protein [Xanthobacteraceae bacterium]